MDEQNWRNTIVSWINQTNFTENPLDDIGNLDVNEFFVKFKKQMAGKMEVKENLLDFIKRYYPDFEPDLDETGQMVVQDFMFTYSLFLHFSCLMYPEPFFHNKCIALKPKCQASIKAFLEILAKKEQFDRNSLRTAIKEATPANPRLSFLQMNFSTPQRTPGNFKNSPPTPTAQLLDEKGREVKLLKAQLDSEKYEKGYLEVQVKQYEESLSKLMKDQKSYQHKINELNNKILSQETENFSPNRNFKEENAKKRLRDRIAERDDQICDLKVELEYVREDYKQLSDKWAYTDTEMKKQMSRVQELEGIVYDMEADMQEKLEIIENLQLQIQDLEAHISQNRAAVPKEVLDSSADLLDFSFNRGKVNCFTDETEEENMGVIIDMKLKEVEHENNELRNEINRHNQEFTAQIKDLLLKMNPEDAVNEAVTLEEHIEAIVVSHECLNQTHLQLNSQLKEVQSDLESKIAELSNVTNSRNTLEAELETSRSDLEHLKQLKTETLEKLGVMKVKAEEMGQQLKASSEQNVEIQGRNVDLSKDLEKSNKKIDQLSTELKEKLSEIESLQQEVSQGVEREADLNKMHKILEEDYAKMSESCEKYKAKCDVFRKEGHKLSDKLKETKKRLDQSVAMHEELKMEFESVKKDLSSKEELCKNLERDFKASDDKNKISTNVINQLKENLAVKETKITDLNSQLESSLAEATRISETMTAEIAAKAAEIDQVRLNSELMGDEMTQQINELQVAAMRVADEKRAFEEKTKQEMEALKESILRDKSTLMESITSGLEHLVLALSQVQPRIKMLQDMIANLECQIKEHKDQNQLLSLKNIELEGNLLEAKTSITLLDQKVQENSSQVVQLTKELQSKSSNLDRALSDSKDSHSKLFEENKDLKCQNESLSNVATRYSQAIDTGNRQIEELTNDLSSTSQDLERVRGDKIGLETEIRSHLSHISQLETDLNGAETEIRHMNEKLQERCAEMEKFQGLYQTETKLTESLNNELDINKAEKSVLTESVKQLETECVALADKLDELKLSQEKMAIEKAEFELRVATLVEEKTVLIQSLDKLSSEHQTVMEENDAINESNKKVVAKLELIAVQKQQTTRNIMSLKESVQNLKKENQNLKHEVQTAVEENAKLVREKLQGLTIFETIGSQVDTLKTDIESHKSANQELIEKNKVFETQVESLQKEIEELKISQKTNLESITKEKSEVVKKLEAANEKLRLSTQEIEDKETEIRELSQKMDETQAALVKKDGERNLFEMEIKKHEQEVVELQNRIAEQEHLVAKKAENLQEIAEKLEQYLANEVSLTEEIQKLQETNKTVVADFETEVENLKTTLNSKEVEVTDLRKDISVLTQKKALLERDLKRIEQDRRSIEEEAARVKQELNDHQATLNAEIAALNLETSQIKEENHKLQQTIFTCEQKLRESESTLDNLRIKSQTELTELRIQHDNVQSELAKAKEQLEDIQNTINTVTQQNIDVTATNEKMRLDNETLIKSNEELQVKYVAMREASSSKADIERLEKQFKESDAEKAKQNEKIMEMFKKSQQLAQEIAGYKAKETKLMQDVHILNAKLHKHRDHSGLKEKEYEEKVAELQKKLELRSQVAEKQAVEIRNDLEGRLQKMKDKMTTMHNEDIARVKGVHKQELLELRHEHSEVLGKYEKLRATSEKLSKQLHVKNDENLDLLKQNIFMESKIRLMENPSESGSTRSLAVKKSMPPPAFGNMKMEDEPGEEFDNTYLTDLKLGRMPEDYGRNSMQLSEIQRRNSQWKPHMRSVYASVFNDNDIGEDEIRDGMPLGANDSHMSLLSNGQGKGKKIGGKTAYHRPGPPTPSKNAGRLSFEPGEGRLSGIMPPAKKEKSPFKMFRSSKIKDETTASPARRRLSNLFSRNRK